MITIRQLEAFRAVIHNGTVTGAAEALNLSQPAVSKLIASLEHETALQLFERRRKRLVPTPEGELLYLEAEKMVLGLTELERIAEGLRSLSMGQLNIVSMPALGQRYLPRIISSFLAEHSRANITLHVHGSQVVNQWVVGQQVDLGISLLNIEHPSVSKSTLCQVEAVVALPPDHPLTTHAIIEPRDLAGIDFISFTRDTRMRHAIDQVFEAADVDRRIQLEVYISEAACSFVAEGLGVALVDPFTAATFAREGAIAIRSFRPAVPYQVRLLRPRHRASSRLAEAFIQFLEQEIPVMIAHQGISSFSAPGSR